MPTANELFVSPMASAAGAVAITTSDTALLAQVTRGVYVGVAGNISALMADDSVVSFAGAQAGSILALRVKRINATGTTATSLVALY